MTDLYMPRARRFDEVAGVILARIRSGELQAGDRLPPERKLVEEFGVSRTAVREALRSLAAQGLIDSHVGRGTFVRTPSVQHLAAELSLVVGRKRATPQKLRSARQLLEGVLATRAIDRMTDESAQAIATAHEEGDDAAFFEALATAAGEPLFGPLLAALCVLEPCERTLQKSSKGFVNALVNRDPEALEAALSTRKAMPLAA